MSQELLSVDGIDDIRTFDAEQYTDVPFRAVPFPAGDVPEVRGQAAEIIGSVLGLGQQADSDAAARLRAHVAAHPEEPERALLEHLMETGRINRTNSQLF